MLCWLCCAAGVCESSLVVCAHEQTAIERAAGWKLNICQFERGVCRLCCAAGVCESSLVACAHEHGAMIVGAG